MVLVSLMVGINMNKFEFIFGTLPLFHSNILSHGLGFQKCEARVVGPRKPCGGFIELGLTELGLGWPAASRPGRHITMNLYSLKDDVDQILGRCW